MCGIAGLLLREAGLDADALRGQAARMAETLRHRGPDAGGAWADAAAGVALGHRRLSIQDLSEAGRQPMVSACERWVLSYNGEVYNFPELRRDLEKEGASFRGHSDTEVLLAGIAAWGLEETLRRAVGMFAFAVWDRRERRLRLARDRAGQKPLYYGSCGGDWLFGSELKALRAHPSFEARIDPGAAELLLRLGWVPGPRTIYRDIRKLPAGTWIELEAGSGSAEPRSWWTAREVAERGEARPFPGSLEQATDALESALGEAVGGRMIADVSLGALLSGGIDSSAVVALMRTRSDRPVKTFTIGFHEPEFDEAPQARAVAEHLGTDHTELTVSHQDALELVPRLPELYDEPLADASQLPTCLVSRLARSEVAVALTGDGGDELFAGYNRYRRCMRIWERHARWPAALRQGASAGLGAAAAGVRALLGPRRPAARLAKSARGLGASDPADLLARLRASGASAGPLLRERAETHCALHDPRARARLRDPVQAMMTLDFTSYLVDDVLVKADRASMAVGLELRSPFLDHRVVELAWSLPLSHRLGADGGKVVVRRLLERHLPRALFERRKQGFGVPIGAWLRGPLREWAEELLAPGRLAEQGLLRPRAVEALWREHLSGRSSWDNVLWSLLALQAWIEAHPGGPPPV